MTLFALVAGFAAAAAWLRVTRPVRARRDGAARVLLITATAGLFALAVAALSGGAVVAALIAALAAAGLSVDGCAVRMFVARMGRRRATGVTLRNAA